MISSLTGSPTPQTQAQDCLEAILRANLQKIPCVLVQSPPGGGKTGIVERVALHEMACLQGRCMIVTRTNAQAFDLAYRLCTHYPRYRFYLLLRKGRSLPDTLAVLPNLSRLYTPSEIPPGPVVVIGNVDKWATGNPVTYQRCTCQIFDEANQLAEYQFEQAHEQTQQTLLVGDPGQLPPIITSSIERWQNDPAGPHVPCPQAQKHHAPTPLLIHIPVSRRLSADTISWVQPVFYPGHQFVAYTPPGQNHLFASQALPSGPFGHAIQLALSDAGFVQIELPAQITTECDEPMIETILTFLQHLLDCQLSYTDSAGPPRPVTPSMIGIICAHRSQVNAIARRLPQPSPILVETADRYQGLERLIMIALHPLSGRMYGDSFHVDAHRLCTMVTRHRYCCFLFTRAGITDMLHRSPPGSSPLLAINEQNEYIGWKAHALFLSMLEAKQRVLHYP